MTVTFCLLPYIECSIFCGKRDSGTPAIDRLCYSRTSCYGVSDSRTAPRMSEELAHRGPDCGSIGFVPAHAGLSSLHHEALRLVVDSAALARGGEPGIMRGERDWRT
jgi:hypothetical protein